MMKNVGGEPRPAITGKLNLANPGGSNPHDGEFSGYEKGVARHQQQGQNEPERDVRQIRGLRADVRVGSNSRFREDVPG
jgi:hypothetical protein